MAREVKTGIIVTGKDVGATKALKAVSQEGAKAETKLTKLSNATKEMPDKFGKGAAALMMFQGAAGQMGGKAIDAANKLSALASVAMVGGPLGMAIAGITAAVGVATALWSHYNDKISESTMSAQKMSIALMSLNNDLRQQSKVIQDQIDMLDHWGETVDEKVLRKADEEIERTQEMSLMLQREQEARRARVDELEKEIKAAEHYTAAERMVYGITDERLSQMRKEIEETREQISYYDIVINRQEQKIDLAAKEAAAMAEKIRRQREEREETQKLIEIQTKRAERERQIAQERAKRDQEEKRRLQELESFHKRFYMNVDRMREQDAKRHAEYQQKMKVDQANVIADMIAKSDEQKEAIEKNALAMGEAMGNMVGAWVAAYARGEATVGDLLKSIASEIMDMVKRALFAYAVEAAGSAMKDGISTGMPWGLAIGAGFAAAAFAAVEGVMQGFATGGFVQTGIPGRDSAMIMAMPGEYVMSTQQVGGFVSFAKRLLGERDGEKLGRSVGMMPGSRARDLPAPSDGSRPVTIINKIWQPDTVGMVQMTRAQSKAIKRLQRRGMM